MKFLVRAGSKPWTRGRTIEISYLQYLIDEIIRTTKATLTNKATDVGFLSVGLDIIFIIAFDINLM